MPLLPLKLKSLEEDDDAWIIEQKTFNILNDYLQPDSTTLPTTAAQDLDALTPMKREAVGSEVVEDPESFLLETWGTFIAIVKQIPYDHESQAKMIQLMEELVVLPSTEVEIWGSKTRVWTDLPLLPASVREAWIEPAQTDDTYEPFEQWVNFNAFVARMLESGLVEWYHFAVWALRDALEEERLESKDRWYCRIHAAAQWIEQSGRRLFQALESTEIAERDVKNVSNGPLFQGKGGLSKERWSFWKQRFLAISDLDIAEDVKTIAVGAAKLMEKME